MTRRDASANHAVCHMTGFIGAMQDALQQANAQAAEAVPLAALQAQQACWHKEREQLAQQLQVGP